jgi:digeranylgeranylglycerophospholipid reductase
VNRSVDVLVVGAGPGGTAAAWRAAEAGLAVLVVEKRSEIGVPAQCAGFVPDPLIEHARGAGVLRQRVERMASHLPSGAVEYSDFPGLMVDRSAFDKALADRAACAGAVITTRSRLASIDTAESSARIVAGGGSEVTVGYRALIAADGPASVVARLLGLERLATVQTRQYTVPLRRAQGHTDIWLSEEFPGGYAWLFPKGDVANLGLGADRRLLPDLKAPLERLRAKLVAERVVGPEILARTGGAIPVGGMRASLVHGNALFVGDAAGLTHPVTGAGIAAAVQSGELAGAAAAAFLSGRNPSALAEYDGEVRALFGSTLERALKRRAGLESRRQRAGTDDDAVQRSGWIAFREYYEA